MDFQKPYAVIAELNGGGETCPHHHVVCCSSLEETEMVSAKLERHETGYGFWPEDGGDPEDMPTVYKVAVYQLVEVKRDVPCPYYVPVQGIDLNDPKHLLVVPVSKGNLVDFQDGREVMIKPPYSLHGVEVVLAEHEGEVLRVSITERYVTGTDENPGPMIYKLQKRG